MVASVKLSANVEAREKRKGTSGAKLKKYVPGSVLAMVGSVARAGIVAEHANAELARVLLPSGSLDGLTPRFELLFIETRPANWQQAVVFKQHCALGSHLPGNDGVVRLNIHKLVDHDLLLRIGAPWC